MLFILLSMFAVQSYAHDIEVKNADGVPIYYKWKNSKKELSVSYRGDYINTYSYEYQGEVVIPAYVYYGGVKYPVTSIGKSAFESCATLTSVTVPNSVTFIEERAFQGCRNITSISLSNSVISIGSNAFSDCIGLTSFNIPNSVTSIGDWAFCNCQGLTSITFPNSVTSIGVKAFNGCIGLTSVTIPKAVTSIGGGVFSGCSGLTMLKVDEGNRIYDSRDNCNAIIMTATNKLIAACQATASIPNNVKSIGEYAFFGCMSLTSITIPSGVTSIEKYAFEDCSNLISITIPNRVTSIGAGAFHNCNRLTSITIPNGVRYIEADVFSGCASLTSVTLGDRVVSIGASAFNMCTTLTSITIPNSVLSIEKWAFSNCTGLTSVSVGNSVMAIDYGVFQNCKKLKEVICLAENVMTTNLDAFWVTPIQNATLKVPENSIDLYKAQKPWSDFGKIVVYSPDNEAANSVIAMIKAIGKVVYTDVSKVRIDAARTAYEALTDVQKALVTNVATLIAAEAKYLELQEMANGINVVSVDDAENIWYDLSGRQLCKKPVTKGIYILNDKTVLIK